MRPHQELRGRDGDAAGFYTPQSGAGTRGGHTASSRRRLAAGTVRGGGLKRLFFLPPKTVMDVYYVTPRTVWSGIGDTTEKALTLARSITGLDYFMCETQSRRQVKLTCLKFTVHTNLLTSVCLWVACFPPRGLWNLPFTGVLGLANTQEGEATSYLQLLLAYSS